MPDEMPKIRDLLDIKTGYADFIVLKTDYKDRKKNIDRMAMYRPTTGHRKAFMRLAQGLKNPMSKKFYLLSGSYGTGKSHLALMFANYLSYSSSSPEIKGFFENFRSVDPEHAEELSNLRRNGRFLVCICDSPGGSGNFEDLILKSLREALDREGIPFNELTQFDEAVRQLEDWKVKEQEGKLKAPFYKLFSRELSETYNEDIDVLIGKLKKNISGALETFKEIYKSIMDRGFSFKAENITGIISSILKKEEFKNRFIGMAFFYDEFQYVLEERRYSKNVIHGFMEDICHNANNVLFIGCIHKDFKLYSDTMSKSDFEVFFDRITQIDLTSEGIEEIINAIIQPKTDHPYLQKEKNRFESVFSNMLPMVKSLKLFPWIDNTEKLKEKILFNLYPMHPVATFTLIELSTIVGSNARSTFSFFSGKSLDSSEDNPNNFISFVSEHRPIENNVVTLLKAERIYSYFERELSASNNSLDENRRRYVLNYKRSLEEWHKYIQSNESIGNSDYYENILKVILLYSLSGKIPATLDNIAFGMFEVGSGKSKLKRALEKLEGERVLFFNKRAKTYEFISAEDIDYVSLIEQWMENPDNRPQNIVDEILRISQRNNNEIARYEEAESYNIQFTEDKRFLRKFVDAKDLGDSFFKSLSNELENGYKFLSDGKGYDGIVIYVIAQNEKEIQMAKAAISKNNYNNVVIGIPDKPVEFTDLVLHVLGGEELLRKADKPNSNIPASTRTMIHNYLYDSKTGYATYVKNEFNKIISGESLNWFGKNGKALSLIESIGKGPVDIICADIFNRRVRIKHRNLNKRHDVKAINGKNNTFKVCVNELVSQLGYIGIDSGAREDECQKDYFLKVLKNRNCLHLETREGNVEYFEPEYNIKQWADDNTAMRDFFLEIESKKDKSPLLLQPFIMKMLKPPYGAGLYNVIFSIAFLKWFYKDSIKIYKDDTLEAEIGLNNYNDITILLRAFLENDLSNGSEAVFVLKSISKDEINFINQFYEIISDNELQPGKRVTFKMLKSSLVEFWNKLQPAVRHAIFLEGTEKELIEKWNNLIESINATDSRDFFLSKCLPALKLDEDTKIDSKTSQKALNVVKDVKHIIRNSKAIIERKVLEGIGSIFIDNPNSASAIEAIKSWFKGLADNQKNFSNYSQDNRDISITVYEQIETNYENLKKALTETIPSSHSFSLGPVFKWTTNKLKDYIALFKEAKETIDNALQEIEGPIITINNGIDRGSNTYEIAKGGRVSIKPKNKGEKLFVKNRIEKNFEESESFIINADDIKSSDKSYELYSQDPYGNRSRVVTLRVIIKESKGKITEIHGDELIATKAEFIIPEQKEEVKVFLVSAVDFLCERGLIEKEKAEELKRKINESL